MREIDEDQSSPLAQMLEAVGYGIPLWRRPVALIAEALNGEEPLLAVRRKDQSASDSSVESGNLAVFSTNLVAFCRYEKMPTEPASPQGAVTIQVLPRTALRSLVVSTDPLGWDESQESGLRKFSEATVTADYEGRDEPLIFSRTQVASVEAVYSALAGDLARR